MKNDFSKAWVKPAKISYLLVSYKGIISLPFRLLEVSVLYVRKYYFSFL